MNKLFLIATTWYVAVYLVRLLGVALHFIRVRRVSKPVSEPTPDIGVTILRPLLGTADSNLVECLESTFEQTYPAHLFEILMCVADSNDPAVAVAEQLIAKYPQVNARLLIGRNDNFGINPKVCNLVKGYKQAAHDLLWALDSNVVVSRDALRRAVPCFANINVQLVHHLPVAWAETRSCFGGVLDEIYMLTAHSTFYTGINAVGIAPCVTGKSNLYRRSDLDRSVQQPPGCGLQQFAKFMAEDQMISESLWAQGGRTQIAPDAAVQPLGAAISVFDFWLRRSRWIRLRKYMVTSATLVEPFTDCLFGTLFYTLVCGLPWSVFAVLCLLWAAVDLFNYRVLSLYMPKKSRNLSQWATAWLVRELIAFPLWFYAMSGRRISWRGYFYKIRPDLEAERLGAVERA